VVLLFAMLDEAKPAIEKFLGLTAEDGQRMGPCLVFRGNTLVDGKPLTIVCNGKDKATGVDNVCPVPAAVATFLITQQLRPDALINVGTAGEILSSQPKPKTSAKELVWIPGGFSYAPESDTPSTVGNIYIPDTLQYHDRRIPISDAWKEYGLGTEEPTTGEALRKFAEAAGWKTGLCTTGGSLDYTGKDMDVITNGSNGPAMVKEMEAAAIGWVCRTFNQKYFMIKVITDIVKEYESEAAHGAEFFKNLPKVAPAMANALDKIIEFTNENGIRALTASTPATPGAGTGGRRRLPACLEDSPHKEFRRALRQVRGY